jgi:hypothetical protein
MLDDGVVAAFDESMNVVGACGCESQNQYQLFGLKRLDLTGQMQVQVHRSDVLASVTNCAIVNGDQIVQKLTWALLQTQ